MLRVAWGIAVGLAVVLAGSAVAGTPQKVTASRDGWTATLRYTLSGSVDVPEVRAMRLTVARDGQTVRSGPLGQPQECRSYPCAPAAFGQGSFLQLVDLGLAAPVALVWLWTGGAHCCTVVTFVPLEGGRRVDRNFGNPGASLAALDGDRVVVTADDRFSYLFTSYAAWGRPVHVLAFTGTRLADVTREHPALVRDDARSHWAAYVVQRRAAQGETRGVFAAWAADQCVLGQRAKLEAALTNGVRRGFFAGRAASDLSGPRGAGYAKALRRKLAAFGYCR